MSGLSTVRFTPRTVDHSAAALLNARAPLAWLLVLFVVSSATAERLPIRTYTTEDGLAHARVRRMVRDARGFLWFCTIDGLSRFDGAEFVTYRTDDGLPDPWVTDLLTTRDGAYWVATNGGVARFDPLARRAARDGRRVGEEPPRPLFRGVAFEGSPIQRQVRVLLEDRAGRVWAGGRGGLSVLDRSGSAVTFRPVVPSPVAMVTSLVEGADGSLWIGTLGGLFHRRASGDVLPEPTAARAGVRHVRALASDDDGRLWVGHDEGLLVLGPGAGVPRLASSTVRRLRNCGAGSLRHRRLHLPTRADDACTMTLGDGLVDRRVRALMVGSDGHVHVGTVAGLSDIDGAHITSVSQAQGLADDAINAVSEDGDGNLWIGTDASGAVRIAAVGLVSYFDAEGLRNDYVPFLIEGDAGRVIAVSGLYFTINEFDGRRFVAARFNVPRGVPDDRYFCVLRDHLGAWWVGTAMGLFRFPPARQIANVAHLLPDAHYARRPALPSDDLFPLFEDIRGDIWLIAQLPDHVRLLRWRRATDDFQTYGASEGLPNLTSRPAISRPAIIEGPAGQLFFGFREAGLFAYRDGRFEAILDRGQPVGVATLHVDRRGRLWIVGGDGSVSRLDNLSTRRLASDTRVGRSLVGANVRCMVEDASGHFYFGTTSGIIEIDPKTGATWRYTTAEGLAQNEVWSALASRRGDLWFGTIAGVSRLDATRSRPRTPAPRALITTVHVNGDARLVSELGDREVSGLILAPGERGVAIDFFALSFASGERLRYQYRLEGAAEDWSPPTPLRSVNYAHLSPGAYRFLVRAVTLSGATSATPASVSFRILPPVWRRWWFVVAASALVLGLVALFYRYRVAQLVAIERIRTRIATDLHDDIGASLSQIAILSELALGDADTRPETANTLGRIATTSRELVESMGDIVWAINPRRDRVGDLLQRMRHFASDTFTGKNIEFSFRAPDAGRDLALATDVRREVLLIFKEAVNNIARHARCSHADIDVRIEHDGLVVQVADDGQGLSPSSGRGDGHGLRSMQERATRLNGCLNVDTSPGGGTRLMLRVPWRRPRTTT
jgi:signal transduction histidine kinase/ligand-binding sensor domain-containing protein